MTRFLEVYLENLISLFKIFLEEHFSKFVKFEIFNNLNF